MSADFGPVEATVSTDSFEAQYGRDALFKRFGVRRIHDFGIRQVANIIGSIYIWLVVSPKVAIIASAIAIIGEFIDLSVIWIALRKMRGGASCGIYFHLTTLTAGVQAATICCSILALMLNAPTEEAVLLSMCFLMAAATNAGFTLTHHPPAAKARLTVFAMCAVGFLIFDIWAAGGVFDRQIAHILEVSMLGYLTYTYVGISVRAWDRRLANELELRGSAARLDQANRDLASSQKEMRQLSLVAQHANDSIILFDSALRILWVNDTFTRLTGYTREEAMGRKPWDLLAGPNTNLDDSKQFVQALRKKQTWRGRMLNYCKDGKQLWLDINRVPVLGPNNQVETLISIERDVTQTIENECELAEAKRLAEEGARAKSVFLATMSHEIRTPLNAIIGMADLLAEAEMPGEDKSYVHTIQSASDSLLTIINDVLEFSRLDADKVVIEARPFSPPNCLMDTVRLLSPIAAQKDLYIEIDKNADLPKVALGDTGRLKQIMVNLIGNALKFTEEGGVTISAKATQDQQGWHFAVKVRDTGIGVPTDRAESIFQEFQQADAATTRRFGGTGLGLPISRALARRLGGDIILLPPGDEPGSTFLLTFTLGIADADSAPITNEHAEADQTLQPIHVLIAEDNATNRLLVSRFLKDQPVTITLAENGRIAVDRVLENPPDVVLMDMAMPELDGLEATRIIRQLDVPQPWIIALTANAFASDRAACLRAGMDDFITKPVRRKQLISALSKAANNENPLSNHGLDGLSGPDAVKGTTSWTSPPESGTTNGKSTRSSGR